MHHIAQICTYIFKIFLGVTPLDSIIGEGKLLPRLKPLSAPPPSHFFRTSVAVDCGLDYCNALLYGMPDEMLNKLQSAEQLGESRLSAWQSMWSQTSSALAASEASHHCKMAGLTHKVWATSTPAYLSDLTSLVVPTRRACLMNLCWLFLEWKLTSPDVHSLWLRHPSGTLKWGF